MAELPPPPAGGRRARNGPALGGTCSGARRSSSAARWSWAPPTTDHAVGVVEAIDLGERLTPMGTAVDAPVKATPVAVGEVVVVVDVRGDVHGVDRARVE